jgi:hypothetical protein
MDGADDPILPVASSLVARSLPGKERPVNTMAAGW